MKIAGFSGSPRVGGNTDQLVEYILKGAADKGATTELYNIPSMDVKGCKACFKCKQGVECSINDDMDQLYQVIQDSTAIVIGTPIYMWQMTGQLKLFIDRLAAFINPDFSSRLNSPKKIVLAATQGQPDIGAFMPYLEDTMNMFEMVGFKRAGFVVAGGTVSKDDIARKSQIIEQARLTGAALAV